MPETHWWRGFQPSCLKLVDLACDSLLTAALNHLLFGMNGCKAYFIGTNPDAGVNVYWCLTNNRLPIINPFLEKIIIVKKP